MDGLSRRAALAGAGGLVASVAGGFGLARSWRDGESADGLPGTVSRTGRRQLPLVYVCAPTAGGYLVQHLESYSTTLLTALDETGKVRSTREAFSVPDQDGTFPRPMDVTWADGAVLRHATGSQFDDDGTRAHGRFDEFVVRTDATNAEVWRTVLPDDRPASTPDVFDVFARPDGGAVFAAVFDATDSDGPNAARHHLWTRTIDPSGTPTGTRLTTLDGRAESVRIDGAIQRSGDAVMLALRSAVAAGETRIQPCTLAPGSVDVGDGLVLSEEVQAVTPDGHGGAVYEVAAASETVTELIVVDPSFTDTTRYPVDLPASLVYVDRLGDGDLLLLTDSPDDRRPQLVRLASDDGAVVWQFSPVPWLGRFRGGLAAAWNRFAVTNSGEVRTYEVAVGDVETPTPRQ